MRETAGAAGTATTSAAANQQADQPKHCSASPSWPPEPGEVAATRQQRSAETNGHTEEGSAAGRRAAVTAAVTVTAQQLLRLQASVNAVAAQTMAKGG